MRHHLRTSAPGSPRRLRKALAACGVGALLATAAAAGDTGYVRLSQGDVAVLTGTRLACAVETVAGNPSVVAGVECGKGTRRGPTVGSYWVSLQRPDDLVVWKLVSKGHWTRVYARPKKPTYTTVTGVPGTRVIAVLPPRLLNVHDTGLWCDVGRSTGVFAGQMSVSCYLGDSRGYSQPTTYYGFIVTARNVALARVSGSRVTVVWSHKQGP